MKACFPHHLMHLLADTALHKCLFRSITKKAYPKFGDTGEVPTFPSKSEKDHNQLITTVLERAMANNQVQSA